MLLIVSASIGSTTEVLMPSVSPRMVVVVGKEGYAMVTAYSELDSCHNKDCLMASGKRAYVGAIACPRYLKLSTRVSIDGIIYVCEDRYSNKLSDRFDIFIGYGETSYESAKNFGIKQLPVVIYPEGL